MSAGHDFGEYATPQCGGLMLKSGKGGGGRHHRQRHQKVIAFPAWHKKGCDVYFSSRWDNKCQIYDHFYTTKNMDTWWQTLPWEWVFIQEIPYNEETGEFVWVGTKSLTPKELKNKRWWQRVRVRHHRET